MCDDKMAYGVLRDFSFGAEQKIWVACGRWDDVQKCIVMDSLAFDRTLPWEMIAYVIRTREAAMWDHIRSIDWTRKV